MALPEESSRTTLGPMQFWAESFGDLSLPLRVLVILVLAIGLHYIVRLLRIGSEWLVTGRSVRQRHFNLLRTHPKMASILIISVNAITFAIYFFALGLILSQFQVHLTAYLASASVIGLAVGFGSQGLVQDVVIGLTLIFSDVLKIGDVIQIGPEVGRVDTIGLRFTCLVNHRGQRVFIPNRLMGTISRFRDGVLRAYVDLQIPAEGSRDQLIEVTQPILDGLQRQFPSLVLSTPEFFEVPVVDQGAWNYVRIKFRLWPSQEWLVERAFRDRALAELREAFQNYPDYMFSITYKVD